MRLSTCQGRFSSNECRGQSRSLYIKQIELKQPVTMAFPEIVVVFAVLAMCAAAPSDRELIMIIITILINTKQTQVNTYCS